MKKFPLLFILILLLLADYSYAQSGNDPLHWTDTVKINSDNIFLLWSRLSGDSIRSYQQVYKYILGQGNNKLSLGTRAIPTMPPSDTTVAFGNGQMDVAAGYFRNNVFEDVVAAWETYDAKIHVMIPYIDSTSHTWSSSNEMTIPGPAVGYYNLTSSSTSSRGRIYVRTGDFLGNGLDQFVLAYEGADSLIHIHIYSVDDNLNPHLLASVQADTFDVNPPWTKFSIATGDLNGDGKDEIVLNGLRVINNGGRVSLYTKIYELNASSLMPEGSIVSSQWNTGAGNVTEANFGASVGNFNGGSGNAIGLTLTTLYAGTTEDFNTYFLTASPDLKTLTNLTTIPIKTSLSSARNGALSVSSGDLNGDGRDELVFADLGNCYDCGIDSSDNPFINHLSPHFSSEEYDDIVTYNYLGVGDLDQDGGDDIVLTKGIWSSGKEGFEIFGVSVKKDLSQDSTLFDTTYARSVTENSINSLFHYAIVLGAFNGYSFRIGAPMHFEVDSVVQPLVVLNTPPTHFDIINGTIYDLSGCYPGNTCDFSSNYVEQSSTTSTMETQVHGDVSGVDGIDLSGNVGISATQSAEFLGAGVQLTESIATNFETKIEATWGLSYANDKSTTTTESITSTVPAMGDDKIFATTTSYSLWVYPVYDGNATTPVDYLNFTSPEIEKTSRKWSLGKTYSSNTYIPGHEVGNVLSYLPSDRVSTNPDIDSIIVPIFQSTGYVVSGQPAGSFDLQKSVTGQSTLASTWNAGWDINISAGLVQGSTGDVTHMTTNTTSITKLFDLSADLLGSLVDSLGNEASYTVTPYVYRSKEGSVVLDYAVDVPTGGQGSPTWWQKEYGKNSDPTFVLPFLHDPEKGIGLNFTAQRYQTRDILFSNNEPQHGDTISITARVRNFSLIPTPGRVAVKFYIGNPNSEGTLMTGINGADSVLTEASIQDRGWSDAAIKWVVPSGVCRSTQESMPSSTRVIKSRKCMRITTWASQY